MVGEFLKGMTMEPLVARGRHEIPAGSAGQSVHPAPAPAPYNWVYLHTGNTLIYGYVAIMCYPCYPCLHM